MSASLPASDSADAGLLERIESLPADELRAWARALPDAAASLRPLVEAAKSLVLTDASRAERTCANLVTASAEVGDSAITARALTARAHALCALNRYDDAILDLERAIGLAEQAAATAELAGALLVALQPYSRLGKLDRALAAGTRARELFEGVGDAIGAAKAAVNTGVVLRQLDDPAAALLQFASARRTFESHPGVLAQIDSNSAEALLELNRFAEAEAAFDSAHSQFTRAGNLRAAAIVEGNLADLLNRQGRLDESLRHFEQAIRAFEAGDTPGDLSRLLTERAEVYSTLGLWDLAKADLAAAIPELEARGMSIELSRALIVRALVHLEMRDTIAARECLVDVITRLTHLGHPTGLARAALLMARLHVQQNETDKAIRLLDEALQMLTDRPAERAKVLVAMGQCLAVSSDAAAGTAPLSEAIAIADDLGISPLLADALHARGRGQLAKGDRGAASADFSEAMDAVDRVRARLPEEHSRVAFAGRWSGLYEDAASAMLEAGTLRDRTRAFGIVERARCRTLLDRVRGDLRSGSRPDEGAEELAAEHRKLVAELNALYSRSGELSASGRARSSQQRWRSRVEACEQRLAAVEVRLAATVEFRGIFGRPIDVAMAAGALASDTVLVQYAVIHDRLIAFVVGPEGLREAARVADVREVKDQVARLEFQVMRWMSRSGNGDDPKGGSSLARSIRFELAALYRLLVEPIEHAIGDAVRLIVSPAGPTHGAPFEALVRNGQFLIERVAITYTPSASVLADLNMSKLRRERVGTRPRTLIVAAPDAQAPWIDAEARAVATAAPDPLLLAGAEATAERVLAEAAHATQLHIACHALAPDASPFSARLKLADRWVTAREIAAIRLNGCDVVLSGCETGKGVSAGCKELFGLVRAFLAAGAGSVVATRWPVHDRHTTQLMLHAYSHLGDNAARGGSRSLSIGLRAAQVDAAARGWHPATWASFLVMGGTT